MTWNPAQRLFQGRAEARAGPWHRPAQGPGVQTRSLCVASGKGGTGKSVVSASLAALLADRGPVLVLDADLGVGNAHILHDVSPDRSLVDLVEGRAAAREVLVRCGRNLDLLAAGSGVSHMAALRPWEITLVANAISELERDYAWVLADAGAGISAQTISLAAACDCVLVVTTPDVTALTDAYAFLKVLLQRDGHCEPAFVVNRASCEDEAHDVAERLRGAVRKFLGRDVVSLGWLPDDRAVQRCVNARAPVVRREPDAPFARAVRALAAVLQREVPERASQGFGQRLARSGPDGLG